MTNIIFCYNENENIFIPSLNISKIKFSNTFYSKKIEEDKEDKEDKKNKIVINYIDISYKKEDLIIQLPRQKLINIKKGSCVINITESFYKNFIEKLEEYIIETIYNNSEKWFSKSFSKNKIKSGLLSLVSHDNFLNLTLHDNTSFFNRHRKVIKIEDFVNKNCEIICLVKIANLQFINNKFSYNFVLEQGKVYYETILNDYSIIENVLPDEYYKSEN
jgi:hypothetical protein